MSENFCIGGVQFPAPYWYSPGAYLYLGDVCAQLKNLPSRSVQTVVTSPPYWGLRDYNEKGQIGLEPNPDCATYGKDQCGECFVCSMVSVFTEIYRVLRDDGTLWLNLGDTYGGVSGCNGGKGSTLQSAKATGIRYKDAGLKKPVRSPLASGNLVGIPWRVAFALQANSWVLRQDIIWYAPNKMPESVTDRCTKSHEYIFLLTKSESYYYDNVAIEEDIEKPHNSKRSFGRDRKKAKYLSAEQLDLQRTQFSQNTHHPDIDVMSKNKRDVWVVPTKGYSGAHFACFSPELITPCILAGTSEHGCCARCATPWERVVNRVDGIKQKEIEFERDRSFRHSRNGMDSTLDSGIARRETVGWRKVCGCQTQEVTPCVVLDPFVGSGTTVATSISLGRVGVGIDLSEKYLQENAIPRILVAVNEGRADGKATIPLREGKPLPVQKF